MAQLLKASLANFRILRQLSLFIATDHKFYNAKSIHLLDLPTFLLPFGVTFQYSFYNCIAIYFLDLPCRTKSCYFCVWNSISCFVTLIQFPVTSLSLFSISFNRSLKFTWECYFQNTISRLIACSLSTQIVFPYISTGFINVLYSLTSVSQVIKLYVRYWHFVSIYSCFLWCHFDYSSNQSLGSVVASLPNDQEAPGSIPAVLWDLSLVENYCTACTDRVFLCFIVLCPCPDLCCLRRRPLNSAEHSPGEVL